MLDVDFMRGYIFDGSCVNQKGSCMNEEETESVVNITFQLKGEDARRFLEYKAQQFLLNNAEAARKLMLERMAQTQSPARELATA